MDFFSIADVVQQSIENDQKLNFKINIPRIKKPQFLNAFMSYSLNEKNTFFINKKLRRNARFLCVLRMFLWFLIKTENILQYKIEQQAIKNGSKIGRSQKWKPLQNRWIKNRTESEMKTASKSMNHRFKIDSKSIQQSKWNIEWKPFQNRSIPIESREKIFLL